MTPKHTNLPNDFPSFDLYQDVDQGSQSQIHRGATFGGKMSPRAAVMNLKGSAGHNMEKMPYLVHKLAIFDHFLCFNDQISNFVGFKESCGPH